MPTGAFLARFKPRLLPKNPRNPRSGNYEERKARLCPRPENATMTGVWRFVIARSVSFEARLPPGFPYSDSD